MKKKVSLADALQIKADLHKEISNYETLIRKENSVIEGNPRSADLTATYEQYATAQENLEQIKLAIQSANIPIYPLIYKYDSLVSRKRFWETVRPIEGKRIIGDKGKDQTVITMNAWFTKVKISEMIKALDTQIKEIREELTKFNTITEIEI